MSEPTSRENEANDRIICPCKEMKESELVKAIHECGGVLDTLRRTTGVATHCTGCLPAVVELLDETIMRPGKPAKSGSTFSLSFAAVVKGVKNLKSIFIPKHYAIFVIHTAMAMTRVAISNLPLEENEKSTSTLYFRAALYDRLGQPVKKIFFRMKPGETKNFDSAELVQSTAYENKPFYGTIQFSMWGSPVVGSTRPYAYWMSDGAVTSTHDKFSQIREPGWKYTLIFVEITPSYDTDLVICNPLKEEFISEVVIERDDGERLSAGFVTVPALGANIVCPLAMNPKAAEFLGNQRGSLTLENLRQPVMTYYLGHDLAKNRWLIQHL